MPSDWELYEGVLVTLVQQSPLMIQTNTAKAHWTSTTIPADIYLDNYLYDAAAPNGTSFTSITGAVDYSYGNLPCPVMRATSLSKRFRTINQSPSLRWASFYLGSAG